MPEQLSDEICVTLESCPVQRGHAQLLRYKVDVGAGVEEESDGPGAMLFRQRRFTREARLAQVTLEADEVQCGVAVVVERIDPETLALLLPSFDDPFDDVGVTVHAGSVNGRVAEVVPRAKNLVFLALGSGLA